MKKIYLYPIILFTIGCSTDQNYLIPNDFVHEEIIPNTIKTYETSANLFITDSIDELFYSYLSSAEYQDSKLAHQLFFDKLNYIENFDNLKTYQSYLNWIDNNLTNTEFLNRAEAISLLDDMINKDRIVRDSFISLFNYINNGEINEVKSRVIKWSFYTFSDDKNNKCYDEFTACMDAASDTMIKELRENNRNSNLSDQDKLSANNSVKKTYVQSMDNCQKAHAACARIK